MPKKCCRNEAMRRSSHRFSGGPGCGRWIALAGLLLAGGGTPGRVFGQELGPGQLPLELRSDGEEVVAGLRELAEANRDSVLEIYAPPRQLVGLGTVISADGLLLAKASELIGKTGTPEDLVVRNAGHRSGNITLLGVDLDSDLILLKTDLAGVKPVAWSRRDPQLADWVFAYTGRLRTIATGVISADSRELTSSGAFLGVSLHPDPEANNQARVAQVMPGSAAEVAGILVGDYLVGLEGQPSADAEALTDSLRHFMPGAKISLMVEREGTRYQTQVELGYRSSFERQMNSNAQISGQVSERQNGFGRIYQHSALLSPQTMGGPLLDLDGHCVGVNIARLDRTATVALPPEQVLLALRRMESRQAELAGIIQALAADWQRVVEEQDARRAAAEAKALQTAEAQAGQGATPGTPETGPPEEAEADAGHAPAAGAAALEAAAKLGASAGGDSAKAGQP